MTAPPKPAMVCVFDGDQRCIGHVLSRGRDGFEAFDRHDKSIGIFVSMKAAAAAVSAEATP